MTDNNSQDTGTGGNTASWRESLPDDLKTYKGLEKFPTPVDLARSYKSLEVRLEESGRADAIIPPKSDAPQGDWDKFYNKLGRPESHDKYEIKLGDDLAQKVKIDDAELAAIKKQAFEAGMTPKQAQKLLENTAAVKISIAEGNQTAEDAKRTAAETELKKRWGGKFDERMNQTKVLLGKFVPEDMKGQLAEMSNNPVIVELMYGISKNFKEDTLLDAQGVSTAKTSAQIRAEATEKMKSDEYRNPRNPLYEETRAAVRNQFKQAAAQEGR